MREADMSTHALLWLVLWTAAGFWAFLVGWLRVPTLCRAVLAGAAVLYLVAGVDQLKKVVKEVLDDKRR